MASRNVRLIKTLNFDIVLSSITCPWKVRSSYSTLALFGMLLYLDFSLGLQRHGLNEHVLILSAEPVGAESVDIHGKIIVTVLCRSDSKKCMLTTVKRAYFFTWQKQNGVIMESVGNTH